MGIFDEVCQNLAKSQKFVTPRTVTIFDWRLGLINKVMMLIILCWVMFNIFGAQKYLGVATPIGSTVVWASATTASMFKWDANGRCSGSECPEVTGYLDAIDRFYELEQGAEDGKFGYCGNSAYDFVFDAAYSYGPWNCKYLQVAEVWRKTGTFAFFNTALSVDVVRSFAKPSTGGAAACDAEFASAGVPCAGGAFLQTGRCVCQETEYDFVAGAEYMALEFDHSFTSFYAGAVDTAAGELPRTIFRAAGCEETEAGSCDLLEFPAGATIKLHVGDLLDKLGIDLDGEADKQPTGTPKLCVDGLCPRTRILGTELAMSLAYYNYNKDQGIGVGSAGDPALCIVTVSPKVDWTSLGNDVEYSDAPTWATGATPGATEFTNRYRYGIKFTFTGGEGIIGAFDFGALLDAFIQGLVLLSLANTVTLAAAKGFFGIESKMYEAVINEKLSFAKEVARFASQALIAHRTFQTMDTDGGGVLDEAELEEKLKLFLHDKLDADDIKVCASILFEAADTPPEEGEDEEAGPRGIDAEEFINLATEDKITLASLASVVQTKFAHLASDPEAAKMRAVLAAKKKPAAAAAGGAGGGAASEAAAGTDGEAAVDAALEDRLKKAFKEYDTSGDDSIDTEEMKGLMEKLTGAAPSQAEVDDMMKVVDADGSGTMSFFEFVTVYKKVQSGEIKCAALEKMQADFKNLLAALDDDDSD